MLPARSEARISMSATSHWLALLVCVAANVCSNIAFKRFILGTPFTLERANLISAALNPWLWLGLVLAVVVLASYLYAIKVVPLAIAYPSVTSLAMVGMAAVSVMVFGDQLSLRTVMGIGLVLAGVLLMWRG